MKFDLKYLILNLSSFLFVSCTQVEVPSQQTSPGIIVSVSAMEQIGDDLQSRASASLSPEKENMIRTLSLLVFDDEEQHYIEHIDYYRYYVVASKENPEGKLTVFEPGYSGNLSGKGVICAVANISSDDLLDAMRRKAAEGGGSNVISLEDFKELSVDLPYIEHRDSVGLMDEIYMFGYYTGELNPYSDKNRYINISLGRIVSRMDIALSVDEEVDKAAFSYAIRLGNVYRKAFIFPGGNSPKEATLLWDFSSVKLTSNQSHFYYYVGPHTATKEEDATYIEIAFGKKLKEDGSLDIENKENKTVKVALCNDPPGIENRNYQLNRNSAYQISIRLVKKKNKDMETANSRGIIGSGIYQVELDID